MSGPKVSIELISRLIDGELSPEQRTQVELLVDQCPVSKQLLQSMKNFTEEFAQAVLESPAQPEPDESEECLDQNTLMLLAEGTLSKAKLKEAEAHAAKCPFCISRILQEVRSKTGMERGNWQDLPPEVAADPRLGGVKYHKPKPRPIHKESPEQEPKPEDTAFDYVCSASDKQKKRSSFENGDYQLQLTAEALRSGLTLEVKVFKSGIALEQTEITITENITARKIFRGLTAGTGMLMVRRLRRGRYRLHLPVASIEVNLFIES